MHPYQQPPPCPKTHLEADVRLAMAMKTTPFSKEGVTALGPRETSVHVS